MQANVIQERPIAPLLLLAKVNGLQIWRRTLSIRRHSPLLTGTIVLFVVGYLGLSFWLFFEGLKFISAFPGLGTLLTEQLLYLLFACLFGLLLLSNLVIGYTNFFRNREATFLLTAPVRWTTIFQWKFIEAVILASWAFLFLIAPLVAAFGLIRGVGWHFYLVIPLLIALFIILPGVAGAWLALCLARYMDRRSFQLVTLFLAAIVISVFSWWWELHPGSGEVLETRVLEMLDQLLIQTKFAQFPFLPSYWLSSSVIQWADGIVASAVFFTLVLLSHVLFFGTLAFTRLGRFYYETASVVQGRIGRRGGWRRLFEERPLPPAMDGRPGWLEVLVSRITWMDKDVQALVVKDARAFWRDTAQWGQSVMLFGLLGIYIINLRHFTQQLTSMFWLHVVSYLNLGACSLNLATVTTRFVFPQFSMEGRRMWIVGMAPLGLPRVVRAKFWLASFASLAVTLSLIMLSSYLLEMTWDRFVFFSAVVTIMTFSLNGLAMGLGVLYPNFRDNSPSKIVSGFGGTLCLVVSFLYILFSVLLLGFGTTAVQLHTAFALLSIVLFAALSFVIGWLPLKLGLRKVDTIEL
jgi:ABC-2 type transport system permease protein